LDRLGVGFIGSGFIARFLATAWSGVRNAEISAIFNERADSANSLSLHIEELGMPRPKVYTQIHEMLGDKSVNAVWILNPNFKRVETVKAIVEEASQGKNDIIGVCCEKPLARNIGEAEEILALIEKAGLLHGYLENQVFAPSVSKGKDVLWRHGGAKTQRPYLSRAAEEHGGPHSSWFWDPRLSGGGVLLDMSCHSLEVDRFLLQDPNKPKSSLKPVSIQANIESLKWSLKPYIVNLKAGPGPSSSTGLTTLSVYSKLYSPIREMARNRGIIYMLLFTVVSAFVVTMNKLFIMGSDQFFGPAINSLFIGVFLLAAALLSGKRVFVYYRKSGHSLFLLGSLNAVMRMFLATALLLQIAPYVISVKRFSIIFGVLWGYLLFKEKAAARRFWGAIIMLLGIILISVF